MKKSIVKIVALLLALCMFPFALFACQETEGTPQPTESQTDIPTEQPTEIPTEIPTQAPTEAPTYVTETVAPTETPTETPTVAPTEAPTETSPNADVAKNGLVFFENGKYLVNLARKDTAAEEEKSFYTNIRELFYTHTGKRPSYASDFKQPDVDNPAILIGSTSYKESQDTIASLEKGQAVAKFVNNKYVIAFTTSESMIKLFNALKAKITDSSKTRIVIDSTWQISITVPPLVESIKLPAYDGVALNSPIDIGQGSEMYVFSGTTKAKFTNYVNALISAGFTAYAYNKIASNEYYTFITDTQIVNVMFFANKNEVRITQDNRAKIDLPGTEEENIYTASSKPSFTMMGISDAGYPGGMSFIYKLSDGTFFIIDGGMCANRYGSNQCDGDPSVNRLFATLQALADNPNKIVISGWLITHVHNDHAGAFIDLADKSEYLSKITIKKVIYSQPCDYDMQDGWMAERLTWMPEALAKMGIEKTVKAHPGQVFYFADLKLTILGCLDLVKNRNATENSAEITSHNNTSIVSMVEFGGKKALFTADAEGVANEQLKTIYGSELKADILQVAHHGYNNTNAGIVYQYVNPTIVLWPIQTSDWKSGDNVFNIDFNLQYLNKSTITHYCAGAANITFENLTTWLPTMSDWKP